MTIEQFILLNEMEKVSTILQLGRLVSLNTEKKCRIFIYHIDTFYVAACYSIIDDHLTSIQCFQEPAEVLINIRRQFSIHPAERQYQLPQI
jgi:hypothetical protein